MTFAETFLTYFLTILSLIITIKGVKTAILGSYEFTIWVYSTLTGAVEELKPDTSRKGRLKSTLMPFVDREYYDRIRRKKIINTIYLLNFILGVLLITTFFWSLLTADLDQVVANSPYLLETIANALREFQTLTRVGILLFIIGFTIEVFNSIRSLF